MLHKVGCFHTRARQRQDNDKTTTRQMLNLCIPMMPFTPSLPGRCERHHRNAQVQHLSCRLVVVLLWCENTIVEIHLPARHPPTPLRPTTTTRTEKHYEQVLMAHQITTMPRQCPVWTMTYRPVVLMGDVTVPLSTFASTLFVQWIMGYTIVTSFQWDLMQRLNQVRP